MTARLHPSRISTLAAWLAALVLGAGAFALAGCGADDAGTTEEPAAAESAAVDGDAVTTDVAFEPAYPEEVSGEGITAEDASQQEMHSHGGEEHVHEEEEEDHDHDDGGHTH